MCSYGVCIGSGDYLWETFGDVQALKVIMSNLTRYPVGMSEPGRESIVLKRTKSTWNIRWGPWCVMHKRKTSTSVQLVGANWKHLFPKGNSSPFIGWLGMEYGKNKTLSWVRIWIQSYTHEQNIYILDHYLGKYLISIYVFQACFLAHKLYLCTKSLIYLGKKENEQFIYDPTYVVD